MTHANRQQTSDSGPRPADVVSSVNPLAKRNLALDVIRVVAILAVLMIHSSAPFVKEFANTSFEFFWGNIFDAISKLANPLFIMVSGALMLDERRSVTLRSLFRKNIKGIVTLIVLWGVIYAAVYQLLIPLGSGEHIGPANIKKFILALRGHWHMWFLYMILGLYLSTPLIRTFTRRETKELPLYFTLVALLTIFMKPIVSAIAVFCPGVLLFNELIDSHLYVQFFGGYAAYYVMGWYFSQFEISPKKRATLYLATIVAAFSMAAFMWFTKNRSLYENLGLADFFLSVGVFVALSRLKPFLESLSDRGKNFVVLASKTAFGVYIIHPLFLTLLDYLAPYQSVGLPPYLYIPAYWAVVAVASWSATILLSKIPGLKFFVRF